MRNINETIIGTSRDIGPLGAMTKLRQVGIVTNDLYRAVKDMSAAGIGPWKTYSFNAETVQERLYMGKPADYVYKIALADMPGLMWELLQPVSGRNVFSDFLSTHGEGVHHLLFEYEGRTLAEKDAALTSAGFSCIMSGKWMGLCTFAYYQADPKNGLIFEIIDLGPGWKRPEPDEVFDL